MADQDVLDAITPKVSNAYVAPHVIKISNGTAYQRFYYPRPVILIALTPENVGTVYIYPGTQPVGDAASIPTTTGISFLDAVGTWYIRHSGASVQEFRVIDAGGAGNAQAAMSAAAPAFANLNARLVPVTWGAEDLETVDASSELLIAANTARRALALYNASTAGQVITISRTNPAVALTGLVVLSAGQGLIFNPLDCVTQAALYAISSAAGGQIAWSEGT